MTEELLPNKCGNCCATPRIAKGWKAVYGEDGITYRCSVDMFHVECKCGAKGPSFSVKDEAVVSWNKLTSNTRAPDPRLAQMAEALRVATMGLNLLVQDLDENSPHRYALSHCQAALAEWDAGKGGGE